MCTGSGAKEGVEFYCMYRCVITFNLCMHPIWRKICLGEKFLGFFSGNNCYLLGVGGGGSLLQKKIGKKN